MHWHEFIFSGRRKVRLLRHIVFWLVWWLYFSAVYYFYQQPASGISPPNYNYANFNSFIVLKSFLLLLIHATASYAFNYFLLPRYLVKAKWLKLTAGILLLCILIFAAGNFMYQTVFPFINSRFSHPTADKDTSLRWSSISIGLLNAPKVVAAAAAIKLMKYWWLKKKEKEQVEKEKINSELQLLKAQIQPVFLFTALNNIYAYSLAGSPRAPEMLLKLSDLLSYMLYECDKPLVPVEKEIEMMKEYMALEKIRQNENPEMEVSVKGELSGKKIAPFLLLPFIENSFTHIRKMTEQPWINMEIKIEKDIFFMKLVNGMVPEASGLPELQNAGLSDVKKRLTLLYPERHELKTGIEQEMLVVLLKIQLDGLTPETTNYSEMGETQTNSYAQQ